jgi:hypothetical protein
MGVGDDFIALVERDRNLDIAAIGRRVLNDSRQGEAALKRALRTVLPFEGFAHAWGKPAKRGEFALNSGTNTLPRRRELCA